MKVITLDADPKNILRTKCTPVGAIDEVSDIILEMKDILLGAYNGTGKGLAAPQVGVNKQMFILRFGNRIDVFINPKITKYGEVKVSGGEGCLSIPGRWFGVKRSRKIEVTYQDAYMIWRKCKFHDFDAIAFQHEYDHLSGILISDIGIDLKERKEA